MWWYAVVIAIIVVLISLLAPGLNKAKEMAEAAVASGHADIVAFGVPFLANPDLVSRFRNGYPLNTADQSTFYAGGEKGYTDYPVYAA